jgi:iron complex transport system permease protein
MAKLNKVSIAIFPTLIILLVCSTILSIRYGAVSVTLSEMFSALKSYATGSTDINLNERIFLNLRLPRAILCITVGASLAIGGALMQGLFRNPIVEPGLIGTSSGAAFGSALYFVLGAMFKWDGGEWTLPLAACLGAILSTLLVVLVSNSRQAGKSSIATILLTGIAINALFMSGVGFLAYIARDPQARSITFWGLGSLSGANWHSVFVTSLSTITCFWVSLRNAKHLNALMLGEEEAMLIGTNIKRVRITVLLLNVVVIAIATAFVGVISFVGLIVPHLLRILKGSDNRFLIPGSALLGGILLTLSDLVARMLLRPAELPIGIVTTVIGVPVFIFLLRKKNYFF